MSAAVENTGAERSAALPRAGFSQRQSRAHIATVRSADWTQAVLSLTPGSARLLARRASCLLGSTVMFSLLLLRTQLCLGNLKGKISELTMTSTGPQHVYF